MTEKTKKRTSIVEKTSPAGDQAAYYFHQGTSTRAYDYLGCHSEKTADGYRYLFRTWAPNADRVEVVGDFNSWNPSPMQRVTDMGVWEYCLEYPDCLDGNRYKFRITAKGQAFLKADPYAFASETLEKTASVIVDRPAFVWNDDVWEKHRFNAVTGKGGRKERSFCETPIHIYELHLGSWKTRDGQSNTDGEHYLNYREIADELVPYVRQMGYTHVELLPVMEHPFDGSWGYQVCGFYAPTSRFGSPDDFRYFVNRCHENGIGVLLDWVPAHFPKDAHGLYEFDGSPLYEYQGKDRMEHPVWGTRFFDLGRNEVESFLISNALYWLREFHIDGLRVDAVAAMLYLDFDRKPGEWTPNPDGGNQNREAIAFLQKLNCSVFAEFPDVLMIAEESTAWPMVTGSVEKGGLGFNFKWDMGWANDTFDYFALDPYFRQYHHQKLTFPMMYRYAENYILPVSHDEVVHGKKSLLDKMFGGYEDKFAEARLFMAYQITYPGKKLTFMGSEYGQFREWDFENQLEWFMLDFEMHRKLQFYSAELNRFYLEHRALWERDFSGDGFEWIYPDSADMNLLVYRRRDARGHELICALNFSPNDYPNLVIDKLKGPRYLEIFNSDRAEFGGGNRLNEGALDTKKTESGRALTVKLPPFSAIILRAAAPIGKRSADGQADKT